MVQLSDDLLNLSRIIPAVPRVLSPKQGKTILVPMRTEMLDFLSVQHADKAHSFVLASKIKVFRVGVVFAASSCCASGVNNALSGIISYLEESGVLFELLGFLGGPSSETLIEIKSSSDLIGYRNLGGTELLGYGSFKEIELEKFRTVCKANQLTSLAIIAASDELGKSRDIAMQLQNINDPITVTIIPQSRNQHVLLPHRGLVSTSLGFDSARRILCELAGNIAVDCLSSKKYWHFINCGDAALVAEVGLLIRANLIVTETDSSVSIKQWVNVVADLIRDRVSRGIRSGVVMVSQCAFTRTDEMQTLRDEISRIETFPVTESVARKSLSKTSWEVIEKLPKEIKHDLLKKRDANGFPKLSYFSPEEFLVDELKRILFSPNEKMDLTFRTHFLAHESRCPVPTAFDCVLGSCLGRAAACMLVNEVPTQLVSIQALHEPVTQWKPIGIDIAAHAVLTEQQGYTLTNPVRIALKAVQEKWKLESRYRSFGPLQSDGGSLEIDRSFLPLTVMAGTANFNLREYLDGVPWSDEAKKNHDAVMQARTLVKVSPPIVLPLREVSDMSPLECQRRRYVPRIPAYLSEPYMCVDSDICARVCADKQVLEAAFPNSANILPVQIVNTASAEQNPPVIYSGKNINSYPPKTFIPDMSDESDSDGDSPEPWARVEAKVNRPALERFVENPACTEHIMSPKSARRSVAPAASQLVRASDVCWQFDQGSVVSMDFEDKPATMVNRRPLKLGIVFFCSQVPGCHNVVSGLWDYLNSEDSQLLGFLGGSTGLKNSWVLPLTRDLVDRYRNQGGQDLLGHFGESLVTDSEFQEAVETIRSLNLDGLVIVGNLEGQLAAAMLTEKLLQLNLKTKVVTVPVSAENEIPFIRQSVGYDTVTRVFSTAISNLWTECHSSRHRWYFVRLMSHHVSHLALECALATHPNIVLVTEEVAARKQSLMAVTDMIVDCMQSRSEEQGKDYGIVLIPDGVVAAIPEIRRLLRELDQIVTGSRRLSPSMNIAAKLELVQAQLSTFSSVIFLQLPRFVQCHLINGALRHSETGRIDIANVAIERILQSFVLAELEKRNGCKKKLDILVHSLAHQGRSSLPSNFDCDLAYTCGYSAGILLDSGLTGLVTNVDFHKSGEEYVWSVGGFPLVALVDLKKEEKEVRARIEPTTLVMSGSACKPLFDGSIPRPSVREGRQAGPYQFSEAEIPGWNLSLGNTEAWEAFGQIAKDCRAILSEVGMELGRDSAVIESVVRSLENILSSEIVKAELRKKEMFVAEEGENGNILSTCAPQKFISTYV